MRRLNACAFLFMFLRQVYKHNRIIFVLMILFIIAQLFINFKRGMVVSPLYHYGMYSEVIDVKNTYNVFEVEVNGQRLPAKDFSPQQWDKVIVPLTYYTSINTKSNALYHTDIKRLTTGLFITTNEEQFIQRCSYDEFIQWYRSYLESVLRKAITTLSIQSRTYTYTAGHLQATDSILPLSQACN
jgi:hypothetical protein